MRIRTSPLSGALRAISRRLIMVLTLGAAITAASCNGAIRSPGAEAAQGQMMLDMADAMNNMREQSAGLQEQIDSLRDQMARQDTLLRQLANAAGIPVKP